MHRRKLPIGIQTFRQIREEDCYYVDKTRYARRLAHDAGKHYIPVAPAAVRQETLARRGVGSIALEDVRASDARLDAFDVDAIGTEALLFQTGYLTILGAERRGGRTLYRLGYPESGGAAMPEREPAGPSGA